MTIFTDFMTDPVRIHEPFSQRFEKKIHMTFASFDDAFNKAYSSGV